MMAGTGRRKRLRERWFVASLGLACFCGPSSVLVKAGSPWGDLEPPAGEPASQPPDAEPPPDAADTAGAPPPVGVAGTDEGADELAPAPPVPPTEPRFLNLRFDEDFSYLEEHPDAHGDDWRMKLKNIHLGDDWRLDLGGEFRLRMEARTNGRFGLEDHTQNTQQNYRWMVHANLRYRKLFRVFAQGIVAHVEDQDGPFQPTQENHLDVQQLFADVRFLGEDVPLTLRVGRQELAYGVYRLVGPLDWVSTRRRFDAVKLFYHSDLFDVDAFYAKPVVVKRKSADDWNEDYDFYGLYTTYKGIPDHGVDAYFFAVDRTEDTVNPNGNVGDQSIFSLGARFYGKTGPWDYDTELTGQWGKWAGDTVQAWSWAIDGGYTFREWPLTPRMSTGFDWTSGDEDATDGKVGTFNQLFPFDHVCIGMLDLIGRQNMTRTYVGLDVWPIPEKLKASTVFFVYWLNADQDALYNSGGVPILRDSLGRGGAELGRELDFWLEWNLTPYSSISVGYSHFWEDSFVHDSMRQGDDDPDLFILQYRYRF